MLVTSHPRRTGLAAVALLMSVTAEPRAQGFPAGKPIEMTVMFGAGSAADTTARQLADGMSKVLGVPVPVVNRVGAGGALGYAYVAQRRPDGYAIIWNSNSISTTYHSGASTFDHRAFDAVARVSVENPTVAVKATSPWKSLKELMDFAKANPGKVRVGNSGAGSHTHIASAALFAAGGAKVVHVPFGTGQAIANLLGARVEVIVQFPPALTPHVKSGDVRILAMLGAERDPVFGAVPTARQQGFDVALDMWRGIAVPKGTPPEVRARLQDAIRQTVESAAFKTAGANVGFKPAYLPADAFATLIATDDERLAAIMGQIGLKKR